MMTAALVLATVNAPYSEQLDAQTLANCLLDQAAAKAVPGHMSSLTDAELVAAAKAFATYSGEAYPLAA